MTTLLVRNFNVMPGLSKENPWEWYWPCV